jgi:hypothetical protein
LLGCAIGFSGTWSRQPWSKLPRSLCGCGIAGTISVHWILWWIMLRIVSMFLARSSGEEERNLHQDNETHLCLHDYPREWCFLYHTSVRLHLLDQSLVVY